MIDPNLDPVDPSQDTPDTTPLFQKVKKVSCAACSDYEDYDLRNHLLEVHNLSPEEYAEQYQANFADVSFFEVFNKTRTTPKRKHPDPPQDLQVKFGGHSLPVNWDVPPEDCLDLPAHYMFPKFGALKNKMRDALISLIKGRVVYIHGIQGSGKDAFIHAFAALTRMPSDIYSIQPGTNIQSWISSRGFDKNSTLWEEGKLLRQLRDGYVTMSGRRIPYLILITDFDRADKKQQEILRLILDSTRGRIKTGDGETHHVMEGTIICCTANTAGSGDSRGRNTSAQLIDSSILDRFQRKYKFPWMDWRDEELICRAKFPYLWDLAPELFHQMGECVRALRTEIEKEEIYCELSHRAVCDWLGHAQDIAEVTGQVHEKLLKRAMSCVFDGFPDQETIDAAKKLVDPYITGGAIDGTTTSQENDIDLDGLI